MGHGRMQTSNQKGPKTATHTHDRHTQTLMACNKQLPKEEKYLDYYCRPPAGLELSSRQDGQQQQQQRRRNRRKSHAPSRVGGGFLSSSTRRRYNGIVRVGIVHSILDSSSFGPLSSDKWTTTKTHWVKLVGLLSGIR